MLARHIDVLGMRVDIVQIPDVLSQMEEWIQRKALGNYIAVSNVDSVVCSRSDGNFKNAVNCSTLSVPDGMALVVLARYYGYSLKRRVYGPELMEEFCKLAEDKGYSNFYYGATDQVLKKLKEKLLQKYPKLKIIGTYSPPFRQMTADEDQYVIDMINQSNPDILWVGLGCPKQEIWMYEHKNKINIPVMAGVGAAFDFHAGTKKQAPKWMREHGLEWFFRLATEPRRLWKRYLVGNTIFIYNIALEIVKNGVKLLKNKTE